MVWKKIFKKFIKKVLEKKIYKKSYGKNNFEKKIPKQKFIIALMSATLFFALLA